MLTFAKAYMFQHHFPNYFTNTLLKKLTKNPNLQNNVMLTILQFMYCSNNTIYSITLQKEDTSANYKSQLSSSHCSTEIAVHLYVVEC